MLLTDLQILFIFFQKIALRVLCNYDLDHNHKGCGLFFLFFVFDLFTAYDTMYLGQEM